MLPSNDKDLASFSLLVFSIRVSVRQKSIISPDQFALGLIYPMIKMPHAPHMDQYLCVTGFAHKLKIVHKPAHSAKIYC